MPSGARRGTGRQGQLPLAAKESGRQVLAAIAGTEASMQASHGRGPGTFWGPAWLSPCSGPWGPGEKQAGPLSGLRRRRPPKGAGVSHGGRTSGRTVQGGTCISHLGLARPPESTVHPPATHPALPYREPTPWTALLRLRARSRRPGLQAGPSAELRPLPAQSRRGPGGPTACLRAGAAWGPGHASEEAAGLRKGGRLG